MEAFNPLALASPVPSSTLNLDLQPGLLLLSAALLVSFVVIAIGAWHRRRIVTARPFTRLRLVRQSS